MISSASHKYTVSLRFYLLLAIFIGMGSLSLAQTPNHQPKAPLETQPLKLPPGTLTLKIVLVAVKEQLGYDNFVGGDIPVNRHIQRPGNDSADNTLKAILDKLGLRYIILPKNVISILKKEQQKQQAQFTATNTTVKILDADSKKYPGAKVKPKHAKTTFTSDSTGTAVIPVTQPNETATISAPHRHTTEIPLAKDTTVTLSLEFNPLMQVIHSGYENTPVIAYPGDRYRISGPQLYCTPGTNLQAAMAGRIPGLSIIQSSGIPGASFSATIRGRTSILNGRDPLYIIDGVPFAPGNQSLSFLPSGNAAGSLSPFSFIELTDIDKVEVLKDAAATSIYGSRGANGVILITTRRGRDQQPRFSLEFSTGINTITHRPTLMNTQQYTKMRLEAFHNDKITPTNINAPDLTVWDTTHSTDWGRWLIGQASSTTQAKTSITGGGRNTQYFAGINALEEKNVFPLHPKHDLLSMQGNLVHRSKDQKLNFHLSTMYDLDRNDQVINDPTQWQFLAPNAPPLSMAGQTIFSAKGVPFNNPLSYLQQPYRAVSHNLLGDLTVSYKLTRHWVISTNMGYNGIGVRERSEIPISSQSPLNHPTGSSQFAFTNYASTIFEPQLEYKIDSGALRFCALAGTTWQNQTSTTRFLADDSLTNDALIGQPSLASNKPGILQQNSYYYKALFAKATLNWNNRYILDLSGRRDGSSRFGPGIRYGTFWASGLAWIFLKDKPIISLGKLRFSYGTTGNDQIATYNTWSPTAVMAFQSIPSYTATINLGQTWETVRKTEISMDWGLLDNRILLSASWYLHRTGNQLLPDSFPNIGTHATFSNNKGVISQTSGYEFNLTTRNIDQPHVQWTTTFNLSLPTDKLVAFPGLAQSHYASKLEVGKSLDVVKAYRFLRVDPDSGIFRFADLNNDGRITAKDLIPVGKLAVTAEGGLDNTLRIGSWQIQCFIEGRAQTGFNYLKALYTGNIPGSFSPGMNTNATTDLLDHWRNPNDIAPYQQFTTNTGTRAGKMISPYTTSSGVLTNASFVRLRDVCLSYYCPTPWLKKMHLASCRLYIQAQNIATFTPYKGVDPEIQSPLIMPPMRTIVTGIRLEY